MAVAFVALGLATVPRTVAGPRAAASTPGCQLSDLRLNRGPENGAGGTETVPFIIRYVGLGGCDLKGYAGLHFYSESGLAINLRRGKVGASVYKYLRPAAVTVSLHHDATFGIEFTQNLNQADNAGSCIAPIARVTLPLTPRGPQDELMLKWPTGKLRWNYAINWCFAGWRYGETVIEAGSLPAQV